MWLQNSIRRENKVRTYIITYHSTSNTLFTSMRSYNYINSEIKNY